MTKERISIVRIEDEDELLMTRIERLGEHAMRANHERLTEQMRMKQKQMRRGEVYRVRWIVDEPHVRNLPGMAILIDATLVEPAWIVD
jgi:hypothetical protein